MSTKEEIPASSIILEPLCKYMPLRPSRLPCFSGPGHFTHTSGPLSAQFPLTICAVVATLLTASALLNRRHPSQIRDVQTLNRTTPSLNTAAGLDADIAKERALAEARDLTDCDEAPMRFLGFRLPIPDNSMFGARLASRFMMRFPFVLEIWYWLLT